MVRPRTWSTCPKQGFLRAQPLSHILFLFFNASLIQTPINRTRGAIAFVDDYNAWVVGPSARANVEDERLQAEVVLTQRHGRPAAARRLHQKRQPSSASAARNDGCRMPGRCFSKGYRWKRRRRSKYRIALTTDMILRLTNIFEKAKDDRNISPIAITGEGKFFCTGMDLGKGTSPVARSKVDSDPQYNHPIIAGNQVALFKMLEYGAHFQVGSKGKPGDSV
ncbi:hypothetical protein EDD37DRAFT_188996 [Exophiala viscosa]|uniref:uncharacterized protein n=1 Tax=Exophiala viscosa TaxID=2486360 RepID=UPI00219E4890|nr:hypothetical protein EDD37DRAFT_188996 [Exophiala viscosa]